MKKARNLLRLLIALPMALVAILFSMAFYGQSCLVCDPPHEFEGEGEAEAEAEGEGEGEQTLAQDQDADF